VDQFVSRLLPRGSVTSNLANDATFLGVFGQARAPPPPSTPLHLII
jgi:hypothetical protein